MLSKELYSWTSEIPASSESNVPRSPQDFRGFRLHKVCLTAEGTAVTQVAVPCLRGEVTYHTISYQRHTMPPEHRALGVISAPLAEKDEAHWKKKSITTETVTTTSTVKKTTPGPSPVSKEASSTEQIQAKDTLASSSDSESLYNPF